MTIWITSDWHFNHDKEFVWKERGFNSVDEMNKKIIENYNSLVSPDDDVYVLGDLMLGPAAAGIDCIKQLKGKLHIALGNHDTETRKNLYYELPNIIEIGYALYLKYRKHHFLLTHYPCYTGNIEKEALTQMTLNLYGHTHQKTNFFNNNFFMYHCGIDSHNCYPINIDNIILEMREEFLRNGR